jgi:hypothetical protein
MAPAGWIEVAEHDVSSWVAQKVAGMRVAVDEAVVAAIVQAGDTRCQALAPVQQELPVGIGQGLSVGEAAERIADRVPSR